MKGVHGGQKCSIGAETGGYLDYPGHAPPTILTKGVKRFGMEKTHWSVSCNEDSNGIILRPVQC